jgi:hypothetical protein
MAEQLSSADVVAINSSEEMVGMIYEISQRIPELGFLAASPVSKTSYKTIVRTGLPTAGFRAINAGRARDVGTIVARDVECKYLDASWTADNAALKGIDWSDPIREQQFAHLLSAMKSLQRQIYDGTSADASGFAGYASLFPNSDSDGVVDAEGTTESTGSSIYLVKTGRQDVCLAWGNNGEIAEGDVFDLEMLDGSSNPYMGKGQAIEGYVGLQITNHNSLVRICNVTEDSDKGATDDLIYEGLMEFAERYGMTPDGIFMSYRSLKQLRASRTATNAVGAPAPTPTDVEGIPVFPSLGITDTETLLTAA